MTIGPRSRDTRLEVRLPSALKAEVDAIAVAERRTASTYIRTLIEEDLERRKTKQARRAL
jgi:predicted transcriptional regulator